MNVFQKIQPHRITQKIMAFIIALVCAVALCGCSGEDTGRENEEVATYAEIASMDLEYTDRDKRDAYDEESATKITLTGETASVEGDGARVDGSSVNIESAGTYIVSGSLENGQVRVNVDDTEKVQIVLAGASIKNDNSAALFIESADKCFITLAADTENELVDGSEYALAEGEDEPNATLFSKDDLTINGEGTLKVSGNYEHAIYSKDDLVITGGTFVISAVSDGLRGKDSLKILDGAFTIEAGQDCLKASRDDDPTRGFVVIDGGTFTLNAGDDAIHGETYLLVKGGAIDIQTCVEGLEAMVVQVDGGDIDVVAQDDAINAAAPSASSDTATESIFAPGSGNEQEEKSFGESRGDVGFGSNEPGEGSDLSQGLSNKQGDLPNGLRDEGGMKGDLPNDLEEPPSDRGDLNDMSEREGKDFLEELDGLDNRDEQRQAFGVGDIGEGNESCQIIINGGTITLEAKGDAIDSNGSIQLNGGTIYATGPTSGADSALDYELEASCNGGTVLLAGPSGMAQSFSEGTQPFAFVQVRGKANQTVSVKDQAGTTLISYTPKADFESLVISSPDFIDAQTYTLIVGESETKITPATSQVGQKA